MAAEGERQRQRQELLAELQRTQAQLARLEETSALMQNKHATLQSMYLAIAITITIHDMVRNELTSLLCCLFSLLARPQANATS